MESSLSLALFFFKHFSYSTMHHESRIRMTLKLPETQCNSLKYTIQYSHSSWRKKKRFRCLCGCRYLKKRIVCSYRDGIVVNSIFICLIVGFSFIHFLCGYLLRSNIINLYIERARFVMVCYCYCSSACCVLLWNHFNINMDALTLIWIERDLEIQVRMNGAFDYITHIFFDIYWIICGCDGKENRNPF